jgi:hypothetical protein
MNSINFYRTLKQSILIALALIVSVSCLPSFQISSTDTAEPVSTFTDTIEALMTPIKPTQTEIPPADTPRPTSTESDTTDETLNTVGPWLLIQSSDGLWAANPNGSALQQLTDKDYWKGDLRQAIQPAGNHVVFVSPGDYDFHHMALNLLSLPDGQITKITDLTSPSTEAYADLSPGDPGFEALRAIGERDSFAWSPDGSQLAFSGVMDGPSADIYLYDVQSGKITRVSEDPAQDFAPSWSPDGNHIFYLAVDGFGTGAGWAMTGVWAADDTGRNSTQLFASDSAGEEVIGWLDDNTAVLATWDQPCGLQKLRLYAMDSNQTSMVYADCFNSAAVDGNWGVMLYSNENGIYKLTAEDPNPIQVGAAGDGYIDHHYPGEQEFTVRYTNGGIATFDNIGAYDNQDSPAKVKSYELDVAVYGMIWGWTSRNEAYPGAWITGPGVDIGRIYNGQATLPIWSEDNNLLFFGIENAVYTLYLTSFDSWYTDLHAVNFLESDPIRAAWLGIE